MADTERMEDQIGEEQSSELARLSQELNTARDRIKELEEKLKIAEQQVGKDPLTGLDNRDRFKEEVERACIEAQRGKEISLLFIDVDGFKGVNDSFGHLAGDQVLREIAQTIQNGSSLRKTDRVFRYGGEEIAVILPTSQSNAVGVAERIRKSIQEKDIDTGGIQLGITVSIGVANARVNKNFSADILVAEADRAMYAAKKAGKNRIGFIDNEGEVVTLAHR